MNYSKQRIVIRILFAVIAVVVSMTTGYLLFPEQHAYLPKDGQAQLRSDTGRWEVLPAYQSGDGLVAHRPLTYIAGKGTIEHFRDWRSEFKRECFGTEQDVVNGKKIRFYQGWTWSVTECRNRHFMVTNASNKVYELTDDGKRLVVTDKLPEPGVPSGIACTPSQDLAVTLLPSADKIGHKTHSGAKLVRIAIADGTVTLIAEMPRAPDLMDTNSTCSVLHGSLAVPIGVQVLVTPGAEGFLIADQSTASFYSVSADGKEISDVSGKMGLWIADPISEKLYFVLMKP
jgi:hypothetical protein